MAQRKPRRGRISSLDTLPAWCDDAKHEAYTALKERKLTALEILDNFNNAIRLAAFENGLTGDAVPQISRSAFNRASLKTAILGRRLEDMTQMAAAIGPKLDKASDESLTVLVVETIKTLIMEMMSNAGELAANGETAQMLMFTSRAMLDAVKSKKISVDQWKRGEEELRAKTSEAVDAVAKAQGLTADTVAAIKEKILGVKLGAAAHA